MPRYRITADILHATGTQTYEVEADSIEEARQLWEDAECEFIDEEIDVDELGEPQIELIEGEQ